MSGKQSPRKKKAGDVSPATTPNKKAKKMEIDMSRIPESLLREGFNEIEEFKTSDVKTSKAEIKKVPDSLLCPICKEIFISPELYQCGHSVCKICSENSESTRVCPVCKEGNYMKLIPNYIVRQIIEEQFPDQVKIRTEELNQLQELKKKLVQYIFSERYSNIDKKFEEILLENIIMNHKTVIELLMKLNDIKPALKEEEAYYYIHCKLNSHGFCTLIGEYILIRQDMESLLNATEAAKGKKHTEIKKWLPVIILSNARPGSTYDQFSRLAKLSKLDIGKSTDMQEFKSRPVYWIKDVDLGNINQPSCSHYACAHHHATYIGSSSDNDSSDSENYPFY